jgi:hypothetical protein
MCPPFETVRWFIFIILGNHLCVPTGLCGENMHKMISKHHLETAHFIPVFSKYTWAVSQLRWLVTGFSSWQPVFNPRSGYVRFVVDKVTGLLPVFRFLLPILLVPTPPCSLFTLSSSHQLNKLEFEYLPQSYRLLKSSCTCMTVVLRLKNLETHMCNRRMTRYTDNGHSSTTIVLKTVGVRIQCYLTKVSLHHFKMCLTILHIHKERF